MKKIIAFLMAVLLLFAIALAEDVVPGRQEGIEWGMSVDQAQEIVGSDYQAADREYVEYQYGLFELTLVCKQEEGEKARPVSNGRGD